MKQIVTIFSGMHGLIADRHAKRDKLPFLSQVRQYLAEHFGGIFSDNALYYLTNADRTSGMPFYSLLLEPNRIELVERYMHALKKTEFCLYTDTVRINKVLASDEEASFFLRKIAFIAQDVAAHKIPVFSEKRQGGSYARTSSAS